MPSPVWFRILVPRQGGNIQARSGMRSHEAVAHVKDDMVEILNVTVTLPIPSDEVARGKLADRKHLRRITAADQSIVHQSRGPRLAVGGRHAAGNSEAATAVSC